MAGSQGIYPIEGVVQPYSWGGYNYIPDLLQKNTGAQTPAAEYWLGAHPNHPAAVTTDEGTVPLHQFITSAPEAVLGQQAHAGFGRLPYLLKVLDVRQMLSIQVHPDLASAKRGYEGENAAGLAPNAPNRNYKDDNHKPELMVALSEFWLLHGFKPAALLRETLSAVPELFFLADVFEKEGYEGMYKKVMTMPQDTVNEILQPVIERITPLYRNGELLKKQEDFWAARAAETYGRDGQVDRGIFSIFMFNLVHLRPGEGIYQPAGLPHAYLEGQNVELMANSDNVLRAGLTDKHIDVAELLQHVQYTATEPDVLGTTDTTKTTVHFSVPASEFELYQYRLANSEVAATAGSAELLLALDGAAQLAANGQEITLKKGAAALVTAGTSYTLKAGADAVVFRAAVPQKQTPA